MKLHYRVTVTGRVQGVGFRFETRNIARKLGIRGFVKNQYDGSVYIEAEGNDEQIKQFISWCRNGPVHARVDEILAEPGDYIGFGYFEIR